MAFHATAETVAAYLVGGARPDAVFAFSDTAAMAALGAFRDYGILAPEHYSLVGYNNIPPAAHFSPALTTIDQNTDELGRAHVWTPVTNEPTVCRPVLETLKT